MKWMLVTYAAASVVNNAIISQSNKAIEISFQEPCTQFNMTYESNLARNCYENLLATNVESFTTYYNYAKLLHDQFNDIKAIDAFQIAASLAQRPFDAKEIDAINTLGLMLQQLNRIQEAIDVWEKAIEYEENINYIPLLTSLSMAYYELGMNDEALNMLLRALAIASEQAHIHHNLGCIYHRIGKYSQAMYHLLKCTELNPAMDVAFTGLGLLYTNVGDTKKSIQAYESAISLLEMQMSSNLDNIKLQLATATLPRVAESMENIIESRDLFIHHLDLLQKKPLQLNDVFMNSIGGGSMGYYLIYQGGIDRQWREQLAKIYQKNVKSLSNIAPHVLKNKASTNLYKSEARKIRFGVVSSFLYAHSVGLLLQGVLTQLDMTKFEIYILRFPSKEDNVTQRIRDHATYDYVLPQDIFQAQKIIASLELDIILYSEIGMDPYTYFLSFSQLALRSIVFWGHAITSGIPTIDFAITSQLFKSHQDHYLECLYTQKGLTTAFYPPSLMHVNMNDDIVREMKALNKTIYLVPQTVYKLHPAFDSLMQRILESHENSIMVFLSDPISELTELVKSRWQRHVFNVVVLDTFPVGGGRSSFEIFGVGTPIVVHEQRTTILQLTAAMYHQMDIHDLIAYSDDDYVAKALAVGRNASYRDELCRLILSRNAILYNQSSVVDEWTTMLETILDIPPPSREHCPLFDSDDPIIFGVYITISVLYESFAFEVRASQRHDSDKLALVFGQKHNVEPLYIAFVATILYRGVARLDQPVVAQIQVPSPIFPSDTINVEVRYGDDLDLTVHHYLWKYRIPTTSSSVALVANAVRSVVGNVDMTMEWRSVRDRYFEKDYAPRPVTETCVTLVLTTCKRLHLFLETMKSIQALDIDNWICMTIVIDDHSSSSDRQYMEQHFPHIRFIYTRHKGHAHSMNTLMHLVSTRFVLYVEDDWVFVNEHRNFISDALAIFNATWNDPHQRIVQVLLNDQRSGWKHKVGDSKYRVLEFALTNPTHEFAYWPGFSLNPGIWDLHRLKAQNLSFNTASDIFEREFSLGVLYAGLHVATLSYTCAEHIGAPPGSNASAYVLNGLPRRFDLPSAMSKQLPSRENTLFRSIVKYYEIKQYKKGLKAADAILKKFPEHGETLAMKGLTLNCMGKKEEAYEFVRQGVKRDLKSHVCWHVYGLLYRSDRNYAEAIKCYRQALRIDPDNAQILRDLYLLQVQMRDLKGYCETRRMFLQLKPNNRNNWIGLAIAHHLNGTLQTAIDILDKYNATLDTSREANYDDSEMYLYQNEILMEMGDIPKCLAHLETIKPYVLDTLVWRQRKAECLILNGEFDAATAIYDELFEINMDNYTYNRGIQAALCQQPEWLKVKSLPSITEELSAANKATLIEYYNKSSDSPTHCRIALDLLSGDQLKTKLDAYLRRGLKKGIPSLGSDIKSLYRKKDSRDIVSALLAVYLKEEQSVPPQEWVWRLYLAAQHYDRLRDINQALSFIDKCLAHTPTVLEFYQMKGRILKHAGDYSAAATIVDEGRKLDLADRYINNKTTKYMLRANRIPEAEATIALFTRHEGDPQLNLYEMQCMWYENGVAASHARLHAHGPALKKFAAVEKHFNDFIDDQFDFHSYCMRKMTLRAYLQMLRMCDTLLNHKVMVQAIHGAIAVHLRRHDTPQSAPEEVAAPVKMTAAEKAKAKRAAAKARKAEFRKTEEANLQSQLQKEQEAAEREKMDKNKKKQAQRRDQPVDTDPLGEALLAKAPLEEAWRLVSILKEYVPNAVETQAAAFDVAFRQQKYLLCLQALLAAPRDTWSAQMLPRLVQLYSATDLAPLTSKLLNEAKPVLFHGAKDLAGVVAAAKSAIGASSLEWRVAVAESACLVDSKNKSWIFAWLLEDKAQGAVTAYESALALVKRFFDAKEQTTFLSKVKELFPYATAFGNNYTH
ncbi:N-terminal acetyltransferase A complex subunit nat1 [Thraustotheca clavata]|uniref:N-terminal acetyltransferase A complex subunit nat1 n=1 Tax=Thraustotheca clavata TaxID=74557 RepID=A0A1V9ZCD5_9STRA|nr:N-terminal acetyltransferase A complex subunit nat1 [Thraustotheca clavata]